MTTRDSEAPLRAAVGAQAPVTWIETDGLHLAAMRRGRGTAVLCLHAIGHGARDFEDLAARVGDHVEIVALDWPGQGLSRADGVAPSAEHYERMALRALDALQIERAIVIGNSIGGAAALRLAARAPERVAALVLCNAGGLAPINALARFVIGRMVAFFRAGERHAPWFPRAFSLYYRRLVLPRAPEQSARIAASGYEIAPLLRQAWEGFAKSDADIRRLAEQVRCPVFLAWAKSDRIIAWSRSRNAAQRFRDRRIELFRGGHAAFLEDPGRFARSFRLFLDEKKIA